MFSRIMIWTCQTIIYPQDQCVLYLPKYTTPSSQGAASYIFHSQKQPKEPLDHFACSKTVKSMDLFLFVCQFGSLIFVFQVNLCKIHQLPQVMHDDFLMASLQKMNNMFVSGDRLHALIEANCFYLLAFENSLAFPEGNRSYVLDSGFQQLKYFSFQHLEVWWR